MQEDLNIPERKHKQESIPAGEGSNLRETGWMLNYPGQVWKMSYKRFSADGQNTTRNYTTMRVVVTKKVWTAVSPQNKIYSQSFMRKSRSAVVPLKRGKSAVVDNIPAKLVQDGGETIIDV